MMHRHPSLVERFDPAEGLGYPHAPDPAATDFPFLRRPPARPRTHHRNPMDRIGCIAGKEAHVRALERCALERAERR